MNKERCLAEWAWTMSYVSRESNSTFWMIIASPECAFFPCFFGDIAATSGAGKLKLFLLDVGTFWITRTGGELPIAAHADYEGRAALRAGLIDHRKWFLLDNFNRSVFISGKVCREGAFGEPCASEELTTFAKPNCEFFATRWAINVG